MPDYEKMYHLLFNAITDALEQIEQQNLGIAKAQLISAQQKAEDLPSQLPLQPLIVHTHLQRKI